MIDPPLSLSVLQDETYETNVTSKRLVADVPCAFPPHAECFEHIDVNLGQPLVGDEVSDDIQPVSIPLDFSFVARSDGQQGVLVMIQKCCSSSCKRASRDRDTLLDTLAKIQKPFFRCGLGVR